MNRARSLRNETAINSISPERAGGIMYDTLAYINETQLLSANPLLISKIYDSVEDMEADAAPVSDLDGSALLPGQLVCIVTGDPDDPEDGLVYRYDGTEDDTSSWTAVGRIGSAPYLEGFLYMGKAVLTPTPTDPGAPTQKVFYEASEPGTYGNFGNLVVNDGEIVYFKFDGDAWIKDVTGAASAEVIEKKVDMLVGKNLLNVDSQDCIPGKFIDSSGNISTGTAAYKVSALIAIEANTAYHLSNSADGYIGRSGYVAFFDASGNLVGSPINSTQFSTPAGAAFLRCSIHSDDSQDAMLNKGTARGMYYKYSPVGGYLLENDAKVETLIANVQALDFLPARVEAIRKNEGIHTWESPQSIDAENMQIAANLRSGLATIAANAKGTSFDLLRIPFVADDPTRNITLVIGQTDSAASNLYQVVSDALNTPGNVILTKTIKLNTTLAYTDVLLDSAVVVTKKYLAVGVFTASGSHVKTPMWTNSTGKAESTVFSGDNGSTWSSFAGSAAAQKYGAFPILMLNNAVKEEIEGLHEQIDAIRGAFPGGISRQASVLSGGEIVVSDFPYYAKNRDNVAFFANITTFDSLLVGRGYGANYGVWLEIDGTNVKIIKRQSGADTELSSQAHGLTLSTFVKVLFSFGEDGKLTYIVQTLGGYFKYTYTTALYGAMGAAFASPSGMGLTNCVLSAYNAGAKLGVWVFGDSYVTISDTRWPYYLLDWGFRDYEIFGLSGAGSLTIFNEFLRAMQFGRPNYALWGLGMNDGADADEDTPSPAWLDKVEAFVERCAAAGITPILATIPSVPAIYNDGKNKWIRESGHRYVDFAAAVGAQADGTWYSGMLSSDNVHPSQLGGQALATQVLVDFPEIMR
jgi:hypothetical protein